VYDPPAGCSATHPGSTGVPAGCRAQRGTSDEHGRHTAAGAATRPGATAL